MDACVIGMGVVAVKDGGSAFPQIDTEYSSDSHEYTGNTYSYGGMSLRDYFAGQALAGLITNPAGIVAAERAGKEFGFTQESVLSSMAYCCADAMLKAREES